MRKATPAAVSVFVLAASIAQAQASPAPAPAASPPPPPAAPASAPPTAAPLENTSPGGTTPAPEAPAAPATPATPADPAGPQSAPAPGAPPSPVGTAPLEETFTPIMAPVGEAPPIPFPVVLSVGSVMNPRLGVGDFYVEPHVRMRLRAAWVQQDPNNYTVGRTNGFNYAQARIGLSGGFRRSVKFVINLEGAASRRDGLNQLLGERVPSLRDAYFTFAPWDFLQFTAGQFIPPANREVLNSLDAAAGAGRVGTPQLLPETSVGTSGVRAGDGNTVRGLDPGRDVGVKVHGDIKPLSFMTGTYALAVVNGNGQNTIGNDNSSPAVWARGTFGFHSLPVLTLADVGVSAWYTRNTDISTLPNEFNDEVMGSAVDGVIQLLGFQVMAVLEWQQTRHLTTRSANELALGGFLQVAWRDIYGFSPVARAAYYQASSALPQLTVAEFTAGMRYDVPGLPFTFQLAYTHPEETGWGVFNLDPSNETRVTEIPTAARVPAPIRERTGVSNYMLDRRDGLPLSNERLEAVFQMAF